MKRLDFLGPEKGLIFRIAHVDNVPWILRHGLTSRTATAHDPAFVQIGNPDLIAKRATRQIRTPPGGTISDYVAFYFTPASPMLMNICTGFNVQKVDTEKIVVFVSSLPKIRQSGGEFVFTNGHAYMLTTEFFTDLDDLQRIDWGLLRSRDFRRNDDDPGKLDRYQAEALIHGSVPVAALEGLACRSNDAQEKVARMVQNAGVELKVLVREDWYPR